MKSCERVMRHLGTSHRENPRAATALPGVGIFLLCVLLLSSERAGLIQGYSELLSSFVLVLILLYLLREFFRFRQHTLTYFYQIFYFVFLLVSAILIANGAYMLEVKKIGDPNGVFWTLVLFFTAGLEVSRFAYYMEKKKVRYNFSFGFEKNLEKYILLSMLMVTLGLSFFVFYKYSSPILLGVERSEFWNSVVPDKFSFFPSLVFQTFFIAVAYFFRKGFSLKKKKFELFILASYLFITFFVIGQKFSSFIVYIMVFLLFVAAHFPSFRISIKIIFFLIMFSMAVFGLVIFSYLLIGRDAGFIFVRLALQGQLNWSVLNVESFPWWPGASWICYWGCDFSTGADFISYKYLPESVYNHYKESGTGLTGFMPALQILTFGLPIALLLHMVFSFLGGIFRAFLVNQIKRKNAVFSFLVFKIYFALMLYWYAGMQEAVQSSIFFISVILCLLLFCIKPLLSSDKSR